MMRNDPIKHVFIWPAVMVVLLISICGRASPIA